MGSRGRAAQSGLSSSWSGVFVVCVGGSGSGGGERDSGGTCVGGTSGSGGGYGVRIAWSQVHASVMVREVGWGWVVAVWVGAG